MSQGENDYEKDIQHLTSTIAGTISEGAEKAEMSQGENDSEKDLQHLTSTIAGKIGEGVQEIESFSCSAEMSQGENDYEKDELFTVARKIIEGTEKAESFFSSVCIYRVPEDLRKLNERAYTPRLIAIGPLHREDEHLQTPLQHLKLSYTNYLLSRLTPKMEDQVELTAGMEEDAKRKMLTVLQECLTELKKLVDDAKKYYAEEVTLDEEMMLFDGCFILELLYRYCTRTRTVIKGPKGDPIFCNSLTLSRVKKDLVLLENQIPFFVLEKLYCLTVDQIPNRPHENWSLSDYLGRCYNKLMSPIPNSNNSSSSSAKTWYCSPRDCVLRVFRCTTAAEKEEVQSGNSDRRTAKYYHILHNLHDSYIPYDHQTKNKTSHLIEMPSASELVYAGVKFVPDAGDDLFKFKFSEPKGLFRWCRRARFEIPPLAIYDSTESYLRNLIALEQCCPGVSLHVSSYAFVMDLLVDNEIDIQVLEKAGVLRNCLGATKDATDLFNKLCKEIIEGGYFADTCVRATEYSKRFWPKNMAHLKRTYFKSPWTFIAFCVGFIVFIITVLQFVHDFFKKSR